MGDCLDCDIATLESRHRKEKKELQAKIQALKKEAKNDKTKKRELVNEIAKLEFELDARHKQELDLIPNKTSDVISEATPEQEKETSMTKISKAQKRRDKKSQQEKERNEQIKLQEEENVHGPRNKEIQAITAKLKEKQLKMFSIPSDGDCLYKAVAHQLDKTNRKSYSIDELRKLTAEYIKCNKDDFLPFMTNPDSGDMLTDSEFEDYCEKVEATKTWGGQLEIKALSQCLKSPIHVIQASGLDCIEQGNEFDGEPLIITYHRHMYKLGAHYNSTQILNENPGEDEEDEC